MKKILILTAMTLISAMMFAGCGNSSLHTDSVDDIKDKTKSTDSSDFSVISEDDAIMNANFSYIGLTAEADSLRGKLTDKQEVINALEENSDWTDLDCMINDERIIITHGVFGGPDIGYTVTVDCPDGDFEAGTKVYKKTN